MLWKTFKAGTVEEVEKLAREGKLRDLPGFGEKSEQNILKAIEVFKKSAGRFHIDVAEEEARSLSPISAHSENRSIGDARRILRRGKETVGDLDLLVTLAARKAYAGDYRSDCRAHPAVFRKSIRRWRTARIKSALF